MECGGIGAGCRTGSDKPVVAERKKNRRCYDWSHDAIAGADRVNTDIPVTIVNLTMGSNALQLINCNTCTEPLELTDMTTHAGHDQPAVGSTIMMVRMDYARRFAR